MERKFCVLFDMDGVLLDTESQYSSIWKSLKENYRIETDNFEQKIKGTPLPSILDTYFKHLSEKETTDLISDLYEAEKKMNYEWIKGAERFVEDLRSNGIKVGLVTSSNDDKMRNVYKQINIQEMMDTIVSADRITTGKPDPMCYLLAAKDLGYEPENCFVFEDSFAGLEAGNRAGMKVIALSTTNPEVQLKDKAIKVIPDFSDFTLENTEALYSV